MQEAVITQAATFTIDGSLQADYFDSEETENLQSAGSVLSCHFP
ncbi:MAG: DUF5721 family protein [Eubacterium ramulus]